MRRTVRNQIAIALVVGGCVGFVVARSAASWKVHHHHDGARFQQRLLDRFSSKLELSQEQRTRVAAILDAKRQKVETLRSEIRPRFEEIRAATSAEIRQLLNPKQQQTFDILQAKWAARKRRFHDRWAGPGDSG